jgi:antitoxin component YwqK of YwqJK toxin-antitoxin module
LFVACVDENGQKKEEGIIKNGEKDGLWTEWWQQNGQKRVETTYKGSVG